MRTELSSAQEELRGHLAAAFATDSDPWAVSAGRGWLGLTVPADIGGLGLGEVEAVLLSEQLGAATRDLVVIEHITAAETLVTQGEGEEPVRDALNGQHRLTLDVTAPTIVWRLRLGGHLLGLARRALDLAVSRARERRQFDLPIAQFQGVTLPLAAHSSRIDGLRLRLYQLASELDRGVSESDDINTFVESVRTWTYEAVGHAVHVFGASGLTDAEPVSACHQQLLTTGARLAAQLTGSFRQQPPGDTAPLHQRALRRRVPEPWHTPPAVPRAPQRVHDMVSDAVHRHPDHVAVVMPGVESLTYSQLDQRANQLAHLLRTHGVGADSVVAVCLPRCVDLVVAVLGVLRSGAAYLPLDPEYPEHRLSFMLTDSGAEVVLTQDWFTEWLPESPATVVVIDGEHDRAGQPITPPDELANADTLAYIIYTSGSTGQPKGVEIEHRGLVNRLCWDIDTFSLGPGDAVLQHTSMSFDIAAMEIFGALVCGARVVLAPLGAERDTAELARTIIAEEVTTVPLVPSVLDVLLEERPGLKDATRLRYLFSGGEALSPELCKRVFTAVPWVELHNFYGPSEASIDVTSWHCTPDNVEHGVPIGVPLANVVVYLVDDTGLPVPRGSTGELLVGGAGLARGYHRRPDLTRDRFLPDPFSTSPSARVYRTGDLARYRDDGAIEFVGRADEQVKIRGFRVEPGEIETVLENLDEVRQAVVKPVENIRLEAFVTCFGDRAEPENILTELRARLPEHMVPGHVAILPAFPLMPNGKVDREALTGSADAAGTQTDGMPGTITRLMADVLNIPVVPVDADFFDLGGTSLQAARFVARVRNTTSAELTLGRFIQDPTSAAVLRHIKSQSKPETP
jgi:amino acid adenylation domain-containing protein